jgi:hypothetical protein
MNKADNLTKLVIAQTICVLIIILSVVTVKYFFKGTYKKLLSWYKEEVLVTTDINEVLSDEI